MEFRASEIKKPPLYNGITTVIRGGVIGKALIFFLRKSWILLNKYLVAFLNNYLLEMPLNMVKISNSFDNHGHYYNNPPLLLIDANT